jgi:hypothetical protein
MRVLTVLIALVATPFIANVAHGARPARNAQSDVRGEECKVKNANKGSQYGWRNGQHDNCDTPPVLGGISGTVFFDMSYDGVHDADEAGLENWTVMLSGPVSATAVTDAAGNYSFAGLPAGTYTVCESQRFGWMQTAPQGPSSCTSGFGYTIVITAGQAVSLLDFGNVG